MSDYPLRYRNTSGQTIPAFGLFVLRDFDRISKEAVPRAQITEADSGEVLVVNSGLDADSGEYGWCRSVSSGHFWVRYNPDDEPVAGDVVGPVDTQTYVDGTGSGFVVIYVDTLKGLARCDVVPSSLSGGGSPGGESSDDACNCSRCLQGISIPDADPASGCCESHLRWTATNPWSEIEDSELTFEYIGGDKWNSNTFDGPDGDGNVYRYEMSVDVIGRSYVTLNVEVDNGGPQRCLVYGTESFQCECDNEFTIKKPYGVHEGIARNVLACTLCVKPKPEVSTESCASLGPLPTLYKVTFQEACRTLPVEVPVLHYDAHPPPTPPAVTKFTKNGVSHCALLFLGQSCLWFYLDDTTPSDLFHYSLVLKREGAIALPSGDIQTTWVVELYISATGNPCNDSRPSEWSSTDFDPLVGGTFTLRNDTGVGGCGSANPTITVEAIDQVSGIAPTSSGACADAACTPVDATPDTDSGGCCLDCVCYDYWDQQLCADFGGTWYADGCGECENGGKCIVSGSCIYVSECQCNLMGGTFGSNEPCPGQTQSVTFDATDTWTVPQDTTSVRVRCYGGGGGGAAGDDSDPFIGGGGGGGGGFAEIYSHPVTPGETISITVGAGGVSGVAGGTTTFRNATTAKAVGGSPASNDTGGNGGASVSCIGDIVYSGGNGGDGTPNGVGNAGGGGGESGGPAGDGGWGVDGSGTSGGAGGSARADAGDGGAGGDAGNNGTAGQAPGGGGGGGSRTGTGATGADGRVVIFY